ncbi:MAG: quercetin dioxygenase-like cupin family protein [Gammaproteobacteria bacterium]|jgi:quercetin dioxygenase-like cupin family protein
METFANIDEQEFRKFLEAKDYPEPEVLEREANFSNDQHTHEFSAAALVLSGEVNVITDAGTTTCRSGDMFTLDSGVPHYERYGPDGAYYLVSRKV